MGSSDRRPYEGATSLTQSLLNESLTNLTCRLEMIAEVQDVGDPSETLYLSDRSKYVGEIYYEPRVKFPVISRTIGDWLSGQLEFSGLDISILNADSKFNHLLPGGSSYNGFIGKKIVVKVGLGEVEATYIEVFSGEVTNISGFKRDVSSFNLICRSDFDKVNRTIPDQLLIDSDWPDIEDEFFGLGAPIIYGDWTTGLRPQAPEVPAYPVNGKDPLVNASLEPQDPNVGDSAVRLVISSTPLKSVDTSSVTLFRGDIYYTFDPSDISIVPGSDNQVIDVTQKNLVVDGAPFIYETGDQFFLKCKGVDLGAYDDNIIMQGKDILKRFGGLVDGDFDASYQTYADKSSPAYSSISTIKSRVWIQESVAALAYVLSMFEQVRCETFVNRSRKFALSSLHFEDFDPSPSYTIRNWDVIKGSFNPETDERNQWNRAKADFSYSPPVQQAKYSTALYRNQSAITKSGRAISKLVSFPNLYVLSDVENQLIEMLKLASSYSENISLVLTTRSFLKDISEDIILDVNIGSIDYTNVAEPVTARIREIGYDPSGLVIPCKLWSWQMVPYPGSEKAGLNGITGGSTAIIIKET